ncbi:uncharacterized protein LOC132278583 isoform X2 [Cornus florida]|uniref:uncharacterized protein LOC132278583 isoform X2 n=1 Tax=Cornus florida TaxID=4283 RepID=UPI00289C5930|nr:uncharacterized protein LOC132278583 isoform X2 [Cornus florida]
MDGMGWGSFLKIVTKFFNVLAWYASIRAVEGDKPFNYQQCLTYWVLFSITKIMESMLAKLLVWLPFWPHLKGIVTLLLVVPHFGGAFYVYMHFIRPYISANSQGCDIPTITTTNGCIFSEHNDSLGEIHIEDGLDISEEDVFCKGEYNISHDHVESHLINLASPKKVQKEWSCAVCQVTTTSQICLNTHLQGKKHKAMEEELRNELVTNNPVKSSLMTNFEKWGSSLLSPVARSIIRCTWKKPKFGWTKLNADGSIGRENVGFGGLLRDYKGDPICAYVSKAPTLNDIFLVELWAIWRGLVLASSLGIKVIWVESDSRSAVKSINREQPYSPKASSCLNHIWELLKKFEKYRVSHSWRETNRAADHLSKMDLSGSDVVLWPTDFPTRLHDIIMDDARGTRYPRG